MDVKPAQIQHLHCVYGKARNSLKTSCGVCRLDVKGGEISSIQSTDK